VLRFLAALTLAHLLQNSRDTKALHPVFERTAQRPTVLSQAFFQMRWTFSGDLRKILTGFEIGRLAGEAEPLSCGDVAIGRILSRRSGERILAGVKTRGQTNGKTEFN